MDEPRNSTRSLAKRTRFEGCASDRLYNGLARNFEDAMHLVVQECLAEKGISEAMNADLAPGEQPLDTSFYDTYAEAARQALAIYQRHIHNAIAAAKVELRVRIAERPDAHGDLAHILEAWEAEDYSSLAI